VVSTRRRARRRDSVSQHHSKYSESHRKYHTLRHLEECLSHLDEVRHLAVRPAEIELALWFHDAIYDVRRHDNEELSAEWARASAEPRRSRRRCATECMTSCWSLRHNTDPKSADEAILADIDLSILGAAPQRFDEYETSIREEYNWVPRLVFDFKRRSILDEFRRRGPASELLISLSDLDGRPGKSRSLAWPRGKH